MATTPKKISNSRNKKVSGKGPAERIIALAQKHFSHIPSREWKNVPTDLAKNDEHYLYGYPKEK